jgi:hypothetical protein
MEYNHKLIIANAFLAKFEISWDELPDINSLHDVDAREDIIELCEERLIENGLSEDLLNCEQ